MISSARFQAPSRVVSPFDIQTDESGHGPPQPAPLQQTTAVGASSSSKDGVDVRKNSPPPEGGVKRHQVRALSQHIRIETPVTSAAQPLGPPTASSASNPKAVGTKDLEERFRALAVNADEHEKPEGTIVYKRSLPLSPPRSPADLKPPQLPAPPPGWPVIGKRVSDQDKETKRRQPRSGGRWGGHLCFWTQTFTSLRSFCLHLRMVR